MKERLIICLNLNFGTITKTLKFLIKIIRTEYDFILIECY
jgi:hypothetical protein